jgi:hypothetical protein
MRVSRVVPSVVLAIVVAAGANAQSLQRKPGLWEIEMGGSGAGMNMPNMQEHMAQMPPEQRAKMEEYMKQRGMSFGANSMKMRVCLTPQDVKEEKDSMDSFLKKGRNDDNCTSKALSRSATEIRFSAVCKDADGETREMQGRVYDISPEHYSMELNGHSKERGEMKMQQKARWLSADCGNVK